MVFTVTSSNCKVKIAWFYEYSWARSIQPKFPEISVQNSMDRFGPTGKVSKKRVHLLRWTTFPGRTGWNFGWMDRAPYFSPYFYPFPQKRLILRLPIWRLHTKFYKGAWNVSPNNSETMDHKDLRLGQIVYALVFYNISFSCFLPLDGFLCCVTVKTIYRLKKRVKQPNDEYSHFRKRFPMMLCSKLYLTHSPLNRP